MPTKNNSSNWSIARLRGTRDFLKTAITKREDIEEHWQACLCAAVDSLDRKYNVATIDAHAQIHDGNKRLDPAQPPGAGNPVTPPVIILHLSIIPETIGGM